MNEPIEVKFSFYDHETAMKAIAAVEAVKNGIVKGVDLKGYFPGTKGDLGLSDSGESDPKKAFGFDKKDEIESTGSPLGGANKEEPTGSPLGGANKEEPTGSPLGGANKEESTGNEDLAPAHTVDQSMTPWDPRIHAGTKGKLKDGQWRLKPGMANKLDYVAEVEAEIAIPNNNSSGGEAQGSSSTYADTIDLMAAVSKRTGIPDDYYTKLVESLGFNDLISLCRDITVHKAYVAAVNEFDSMYVTCNRIAEKHGLSDDKMQSQINFLGASTIYDGLLDEEFCAKMKDSLVNYDKAN